MPSGLPRSIAALLCLAVFTPQARGAEPTLGVGWSWLADPIAKEWLGSAETLMLRDLGPRADGLLDLALVNSLTGEVQIRRQTVSGMGALESYRLPSTGWAWNIGDVDGERGEEIVFLSREGKVGALSATPDKPGARDILAFRDGPAGGLPGIRDSGFLADSDGNGLVDMLTPGRASYDWRFQMAPGRFEEGPRIPAESTVHARAALGGDGDRIFGPLSRGALFGESAGLGFSGWGRLKRGIGPPISFSYDLQRLAPTVRWNDPDLDGRLNVMGGAQDGDLTLGSFGGGKPGSKGEEKSAPAAYPGQNPESTIDVDGDRRPDMVKIEPPADINNAETGVWVVVQGMGDGKPAISQNRRYDGVPWREPLADINRDGALDLILIKIHFDIASVSSQVKTFFGKGLDAELRVHFWRKAMGFERQPDITFPIRLVGDLHGMLEAHPKILWSADFTGDGYPDLLIRDKAKRLSIYPYSPGRQRFERAAAAAIDLPEDLEEDPRALDLNSDGKADLALWLIQRDNPVVPRLYLVVFK